MENKPLKRNKNIVPISKDHHVTLLFCWKIRTGIKLNAESRRIKNYVDYFWQTHMQPHFQLEENVLFSPVNDAAVQKALDEHVQIAEQIKTILSVSENNNETYLTLANMVDDHVRYEERELFPHLEKVLTSDQLEIIGKEILGNHDDNLKDDYADTFWVKN